MLTKTQFFVMTELEKTNENMTQRKLAERTMLSVGTINKVLATMQANGYFDGVRLTVAGLEALEPYRVKRAIFLATGFGSCLVPITLKTPKPLVRVKGTPDDRNSFKCSDTCGN